MMSMIGTRERRRRGQLPPEQRAFINAKIGVWTNLVPDIDVLSDEEQRDLLDLVKKASKSDQPEVDAFNPEGALGKRDLARLEKLVERSAGQPGAFKKGRDLEAVRAEARQIVKESLAATPSRQEQARFFAEITKQTQGGNGRGPCLYAEHVGVLTVLLAALFAGEMPPRVLSARVEPGDDGPVIVWTRHYPLFGDVDGEVSGKMYETLSHLQKNGWVVLSGRQEVRISMGPRARRVFAGAKR
jgi:hypothetical protein